VVIPFSPRGISDGLQDLMRKDVQKQKFEPDVQVVLFITQTFSDLKIDD
jgi:hypothetical protein